MDSFCRCCANRSSTLYDIYIKNPNEFVSAAEKLKIFNNFEVGEQGMLSKKICNDCSMELNGAYRFFQKLIKTQELLQDLDTQLQQKKISLLLPKSEQTNFKCVKCSNNFDNAYNFKDHMKKHSKRTRLFRCYFCEESFNSSKSFRNHINQHSVKDVCKFCHSFFSDKTSLDSHISEHHPKLEYICLNCTSKHQTRKRFVLHLKQKHEAILFFCGECKQAEYKGSDVLKNHIQDLHPRVEDAPTEEDIFMDEEFLDEFFLNQDDNFHLNEYWDTLSLSFDVDFRDKMNDDKETGTDIDVRYKCPHCPKGFDKQFTFKIHLAHEHNINTLHCNFCDSSFNRLENLKQHKLWHKEQSIKQENERNFECLYCQEKLFTRSKLMLHQKEVHADAELRCNICSKIFKTTRGLLYHKKTHSGQKNYSCPCCEQKFAIDIGLSAHIRTVHSEKKPHICKLCDGRFSTTDHLRKHVTSFHQKDRNYLCSICGRGFAQSSHLKQHTQIHTGERPFPCTACERKFFKAADLAKHTAKHHPK